MELEKKPVRTASRAGGLECGFAREIGLNDSEATLELGKVPAFAAEDAHAGAFEGDRVALAGDRLDQG